MVQLGPKYTDPFRGTQLSILFLSWFEKCDTREHTQNAVQNSIHFSTVQTRVQR